MKLVDALVAGIQGAESGSFELFKRGTGTRATYYTDFEATQLVTPIGPVALDANGAAEIYVNELVEVVVKSTQGVTLRTFVAGDNASAVEVLSDSFTGTDYSTGVIATGKPTTLQAILDAWDDSAGADDWKVDLLGATTTIKSALASVAGLVFNVKDPQYGAKGDGAADDRAAIQAAIDAAAVSGGTVYFPPGTYRVTSLIEAPGKVNLLGAGSESSVLTIDHATNGLFRYKAPVVATGFQLLAGLRFQAAQSNNSALIVDTAGVRTIMAECVFGNSLCTGDLLTFGISHLALFRECAFTPGGTGGRAYFGSALASGGSSFVNCLFIEPATAYAPTLGMVVMPKKFTMVGCVFENTSPTSGTRANISLGDYASQIGSIVGSYFTAAANGTCNHLKITTFSNLLAFSEDSNSFENFAGYSYTAASGSRNVKLGSREIARATFTTGGAGLSAGAILPPVYGVIRMSISDAVAGTLDGDMAPEGASLTIIVDNDSAGAPTGTITWGANFRPSAATFAVNDAKVSVFKFVAMDCDGTLLWWQVAKSENL